MCDQDIIRDFFDSLIRYMCPLSEVLSSESPEIGGMGYSLKEYFEGQWIDLELSVGGDFTIYYPSSIFWNFGCFEVVGYEDGARWIVNILPGNIYLERLYILSLDLSYQKGISFLSALFITTTLQNNLLIPPQIDVDTTEIRAGAPPLRIPRFMIILQIIFVIAMYFLFMVSLIMRYFFTLITGINPRN